MAHRKRAWFRHAAGLLTAAALFPLTTQAQAPVPARRADDFINSIGVCTHWSYTDTPYGYAFGQVLEKLKESGIRHVRDGDRLTELTAAGIGSTFYADVPNNADGNDATIRQLVSDLKAKLTSGAKIDAIEGPNEPDLFWRQFVQNRFPQGFQKSYKGQGWQQGNDGIIAGTIAFMKDLHTAMKADPVTARIPIIGPSITNVVGAKLPAGSLTAYVDQGNFHPYCGGNPFSFPEPYAGLAKFWWDSTNPSANITDEWPWLLNENTPPFGNKPLAATETGYSTWKEGPSEAVHAKYMPRLFLEYFRRGIVRTYSYEFVDEFVDPTKADREANFGLLRRDLTPKPAYTALQSLIQLLKDPSGSSFTPASLAYSVQVAAPAGYSRTQYVKHQLFQKQDGKFYLVIYHEISAEDGSVQPHRLLTHPAMPTTITLPASIKRATVYTYNQAYAFQAAPATLTAGNQLKLDVNDQVTVVELATTTATASAFAAATDQALAVFPNPTAGAFTARYTSATAQAAQLSLVNVLGQTVHRQPVGLRVGVNELVVGAETLPAGLYFVRLTTADAQLTQPLRIGQ